MAVSTRSPVSAWWSGIAPFGNTMAMKPHSNSLKMTQNRAIVVFVILAFGYFLSAMMRGVTGTLAPVLTHELALSAGQLGLLAGVYFFGFAGMQLPLGRWLDRFGPRSVLLVLLSLAVLSCLAFAFAQGFWTLLLARLLGGVGVSACLMAPLTGYRTWFEPQTQLRSNSWMLMAGSFGLLFATVPVQWALPLIGWRNVFVLLAILFGIAMLGIWQKVPTWHSHAPSSTVKTSFTEDYRFIWHHAYFWRLAPLSFVNYGAVVAIQTLWAGPWMTRVAGYTAAQAANGLFAINLTTLIVFWLWGAVNPWLIRRNLTADQLIIWGLPLSCAALFAMALLGASSGWWMIALFCALSTVISLAQPALGLTVPKAQAGRAMTAFNLLLFAGAFFWQWGMGLVIDLLKVSGWTEPSAFRAVFAAVALLSVAAYAWFAYGTWRTRKNQRSVVST